MEDKNHEINLEFRNRKLNFVAPKSTSDRYLSG